MNRRIASFAASGVVLAGLVTVVVPQHASTVVRVSAVAVAVLTSALVMAAVVPVAARTQETTPLDRSPSTGAVPLDPHGLRDARRDLRRPCSAGTLPPAVQRRIADAYSSARRPEPALAGTKSGATSDADGVAGLVNRLLDDLESGVSNGHN